MPVIIQQGPLDCVHLLSYAEACLLNGGWHAVSNIMYYIVADLCAANMQGPAFAQTGHAMRTLESVAAAVQQAEPLLLVGETGTGKTAVLQNLAKQVCPLMMQTRLVWILSLPCRLDLDGCAAEPDKEGRLSECLGRHRAVCLPCMLHQVHSRDYPAQTAEILP